jgi:hypothetical protein
VPDENVLVVVDRFYVDENHLIPLDSPISVGELGKRISSYERNEMACGPRGTNWVECYFVNKTTAFRDIYLKLLAEGLPGTEIIILTLDEKKGRISLGNVCRTSHEDYCQVFAHRVSENNDG